MPDKGGRIASHCKYVLEVSIVYLGVYRAIWMAVVQSSAAEPYNVTSGLDNVLRKNGNSAFRGPSAQRGGPRDANLANSLPSGNPRLRLPKPFAARARPLRLLGCVLELGESERARSAHVPL